jgi:superfamily II DNA or RNA helicase
MTIATFIHPHTNQQIESLYLTFSKLSEQEQGVLLILAVVYRPIPIKKLEELLNTLADKGLLAKLPQAYYLTPVRRKHLLNNNMLEQNKKGLYVNRLLANKLCAEVGQYPPLLVSATSDATNSQTRIKAQQRLLQIMVAAKQVMPITVRDSWQNREMDLQKIIRDFYFLGQIENIESALQINKNPQIIDQVENKVLLELFFIPFNVATFIKLPNTLQYQSLATLIRTFQIHGHACNYPIVLLEQVCAENSSQSYIADNAQCLFLLAEQYLYQMRFSDFEALQINPSTGSYAMQLWGTYHFLTGQNKQAITCFEQALVAKNKFSRRKKQYLSGVLGYFYKLALLVEANQSDARYFELAIQQTEYEEGDRNAGNDFSSLGRNMLKPIHCLSSGAQYSELIQYSCVEEEYDFFCHQLNYVNYLLAHIWCNNSTDKDHANLATKHQQKFLQLGYPLFAEICEQMIATFNDQTIESKFGLVNIAKLVKSKSQWDVALDKLIALSPKSFANTSATPLLPAKTTRLIWELEQNYRHSLSAREQKLNKSGWSKGRVVSLKRLKEETSSFPYLSDSDKTLCQTIIAYQGYGYYSKTEYSLEGLPALEAAVGIDNLYDTNQFDYPIELIKREPELLVSQQGEQLCLSIADLPYDLDEYEHQDIYDLKAISDSQYQLTVFSPEHMKVASIIGEGGLLVPISAKQKAISGISAIAPFLNIQSDISGLDTGLETHKCDSNLVVNIEPTTNGLSFSCVVMPFGEKGPAFKPTVGNANLSTDIDGKRIATERDLVREQTLLDLLDKACPAFLAMPDNVLLLDDLQTALGALEQLEEAHAKAIFNLRLRWPKGKKISLSRKLESEHLQLAVSKPNEWFDISGNLQVNNEQVIELRKLLELIKTSNGRFIELGQDQIIALSDDLRSKLEQISQLTDNGTFHPLASLQIEKATSGMRMKTIHTWEEQTQKMHQANSIQPELPSMFQAQLRDYQLEGFDWASRLAHWGAGACLADDMGLGKTLQALAILLARANNGPALVIAPTSVCFNWQQEALKFTPTLNIKLFADSVSTKDREALLRNLKPFDCVVISYGLLQRESNILSQVTWHSIIADEAQALKNPLAKRTKAAYALKGDFKMITTGTPIENDLSELWSLFRFINPGLLGNLKRFSQRFSMPIENAKEDRLAARKASQGLKSLIQPFILRRMKHQVLTELPSRTEINIQVAMSPPEQAFYEALRLNAIDNISQNSQQANAGEQRIKMLAELVKLRQACCHPKLVMAESDIPSAKLAALNELLDELKLNNHKALIFSQFVGHLQLIKKHIEDKGFSYQYLDGSTPQKERQNRVNAFQRGEGDIFLISLKAGGSGLNLTAADYVIHMDPWWNPAVEDQASDRAHRMGQKRPVTIYRLITQNTIEEKIVALHQRKRNLADKLLSGNETATKLSVDDMLNLLKETF